MTSVADCEHDDERGAVGAVVFVGLHFPGVFVCAKPVADAYQFRLVLLDAPQKAKLASRRRDRQSAAGVDIGTGCAGSTVRISLFGISRIDVANGFFG